jgi:hypothetical protein
MSDSWRLSLDDLSEPGEPEAPAREEPCEHMQKAIALLRGRYRVQEVDDPFSEAFILEMDAAPEPEDWLALKRCRLTPFFGRTHAGFVCPAHGQRLRWVQPLDR